MNTDIFRIESPATWCFHLTNFYWVFLEGQTIIAIFTILQYFVAGFNLFLQVQFPLSLTSIKYKHFLIFGWGEEKKISQNL